MGRPQKGQLNSNYSHGHRTREYTSPTYHSWRAMKRRCNQESNKDFKYYGGRGITYTDDWEKFEGFLKDMGERPEDKTLDRIDNNKSYSKENCKWSTLKEQIANRREQTHFKNQFGTFPRRSRMKELNLNQELR